MDLFNFVPPEFDAFVKALYQFDRGSVFFLSFLV